MDDPFPIEMMGDIEAFFVNEESRFPGADIYEDVFNTAMFFPLQRRRELAAMISMARATTPRVVYEIGTCNGGGLYHWCKSIESVERVIATEIRGTPYQHEFERAFPNIDFLWIAESSYAPSSLKTIREWLAGDTIDCVFIDGDKSYFDRDFDCVLEFMSSDSVAFMHDIQDAPCRKSFLEVISRGYKNETIINTSEVDESFAVSPAGGPPRNGYDQWLRHWHGRSCGVGVIRIDK
jgi:predicted O-methyltransferase YrrM